MFACKVTPEFMVKKKSRIIIAFDVIQIICNNVVLFLQPLHFQLILFRYFRYKCVTC